MIKIFSEADLIILELSNRRRDVLLGFSEAERLAEQLRLKADEAERSVVSSFFRGERWGARVLSFDGYVCVHFDPPIGSTVTRVPLTVKVARDMADIVDNVLIQAGYKIRFETTKPWR